MSTNHTEHYNLSQWLPDDKVLRTDFNEDNRVIDAALAAQAAALDKKADASTVSSQAAALDKKADAADLQALAMRVSTRNCKVEIQTYNGDGKNTRTLTFTSRPLIVHIMGMSHWVCAIYPSPIGSGRYIPGSGQVLTTAWNSYNTLTITAPNTDASYMCNWSGETYYVLAVTDVTY